MSEEAKPEITQGGKYKAYQAEYFKKGKWVIIPRITTDGASNCGATDCSEPRRNINKEIDLISYDQAQALIWMAKADNCVEFFLTRIVPYEIEYSISAVKKTNESLNIEGNGDTVVFSKGSISEAFVGGRDK